MKRTGRSSKRRLARGGVEGGGGGVERRGVDRWGG